MIAPDHTIVEQDMWPVSSTQTFIGFFDGNGLEQSDCSVLSANFSAVDTDVCEMEEVLFSDVSSGNISSWNWTFEGGEPATSTEQNPVVTYGEEGTYDVTLEVSDGSNSAVSTIEDYITVQMIPPAMLLPFDDVCDTDPAFELTGGSPVGGSYSGNGVGSGWFDPATAGVGVHTITYTYTASNGCENTAEETIVVDACTGIGTELQEGFKLFPNPTKGSFEVQIQQAGSVTIQVFNILGMKVYEVQQVSTGTLNHKIDLSNLQNGVYLVMLKTDNTNYTHKLRLIR